MSVRPFIRVTEPARETEAVELRVTWIDPEERDLPSEELFVLRASRPRASPTGWISGSEATAPAPRPSEVLRVLEEREGERGTGSPRSAVGPTAGVELVRLPAAEAVRPLPPESGSSAGSELLRPPARLSKPVGVVAGGTFLPVSRPPVPVSTTTVLSLLFVTTIVVSQSSSHQADP